LRVPIHGGLILSILFVLRGGTFFAQAPVPRAWDASELAAFEMPLVNAGASARHVSPDFYYRMPIRPIYKSYPIYEPGREPLGYTAWLERQEPEIAFDAWIESIALVAEISPYPSSSISCSLVNR